MRSLSPNVSPFALAARLVIRFRWLTPPAFHVPPSGLVNPVDRKPNCANQMKRKTKFLAVQASAQRLMFSNRALYMRDVHRGTYTVDNPIAAATYHHAVARKAIIQSLPLAAAIFDSAELDMDLEHPMVFCCRVGNGLR